MAVDIALCHAEYIGQGGLNSHFSFSLHKPIIYSWCRASHARWHKKATVATLACGLTVSGHFLKIKDLTQGMGHTI